MKKKILLFILIPLLLLSLTACKKEKEVKEKNTKTITLADDKLGYKTTFTYEEDKNYTEAKEEDGGASKEISFSNEDLDVEFQMYYTSMRKTSYEDTKETRSNQNYYKEYKFGKYEAYVYGEYSSGLNMNIALKEDDEEITILFVAIDRLDANQEVVVADVVADKELQDFFQSIKFEETK